MNPVGAFSCAGGTAFGRSASAPENVIGSRAHRDGGSVLITPDDVRDRILGALPGAAVTVLDVTGTADHYEIVVVSAAFQGVSLVDRHRMVHAPLRDVLGGALHAISLKTLAPGE